MAKKRTVTVSVQKTGGSWEVTARGAGNDLLAKIGDVFEKVCASFNVYVVNASPAFPEAKEKVKRKRKAKESDPVNQAA